jgi:hypothetical protein
MFDLKVELLDPYLTGREAEEHNISACRIGKRGWIGHSDGVVCRIRYALTGDV